MAGRSPRGPCGPKTHARDESFMRYPLLLLLLLPTLFILISPARVTAQKIEKQTFTSQGKKRTYYLFVPEKRKEGAALPLVLTLHGSGRDGLTLVEKWKDLARKEGIILAGPDSKNSQLWSMSDDGPEVLFDLVEELKAKLPVNPKRVYLFGHSAGANFALLLSLYESRYFAAVAVHAGALAPDTKPLIERAARKTPISIFIGTQDPLFPLAAVRATRDALSAGGFSPELTEIKGHDHWYYDRAEEINGGAWAFLSRHELAEEPRFEKVPMPGKTGKGKAAHEAYNRGVKLYDAGDVSGAIAAYTKAVELDPDFAAAYNNRGVAYSQQKDYEAAVKDLTRAIALDPKLASAYTNRGSALRSLKRIEEAVADYTKSIELGPSPEAFYNRGAAYEEKGDADAALADYTRAVELDPKLAPAYVNRGIVLLQKGREAEADKDFEIGFKLDPGLRQQVGVYIEQLRAARKMRQP